MSIMLVHEGALTSPFLLMIIGINATDPIRRAAMTTHQCPDIRHWDALEHAESRRITALLKTPCRSQSIRYAKRGRRVEAIARLAMTAPGGECIIMVT